MAAAGLGLLATLLLLPFLASAKRPKVQVYVVEAGRGTIWGAMAVHIHENGGGEAEILLGDGEYRLMGDLDELKADHVLTIRSLNGPENCVLDGIDAPFGFEFRHSGFRSFVVEGVTLKNCEQGIYCSTLASPTFRNCIFEDCGFAQWGGAVFCATQANPTFEDCIFRNNHSFVGGAVAMFSGATPTFRRCEFEGNLAAMGGAIWVRGARPRFENCRVTDNGDHLTHSGGGIHIEGDCTGMVVENTLIAGNRAQRETTGEDYGGGGISFSRNPGAPVFRFCTVAGNSAATGGGGVHVASGAGAENRPRFEHSIIWSNTGGAQVHLAAKDDGGGLELTNCSLQGGELGVKLEGHSVLVADRLFGENPRFASGPRGAYYLSQVAAGQSSNSPCLDLGGPLLGYFFGRSTRTDSGPDEGDADLGYHHPVGSAGEREWHVTPTTGAGGTRITVTGEGFGSKVGKVFLAYGTGPKKKTIRLGVTKGTWSDNRLTATLKRAKKLAAQGLPLTCDLVIVPRQKGLSRIVMEQAFTVPKPVLFYAESFRAAGDFLLISGYNLGARGQKVFLSWEDDGGGNQRAKLKIKDRSFFSTTGEGEIRAIVPDNLPEFTLCDVIVECETGAAVLPRHFQTGGVKLTDE